MGFYRSNDPTNSVKTLKEDRSIFQLGIVLGVLLISLSLASELSVYVTSVLRPSSQP